MSRYENHEEEWREEDKQQEKYTPWIDPRDPNYIGQEDEEE